MNVRKITTALAFGASLTFSSLAVAQGNIIVFDDVERIEGQIEKPEAFYILSPSSLDYESLTAEDSFLDRLYETVETESF